jgi:hypothetical protein
MQSNFKIPQISPRSVAKKRVSRTPQASPRAGRLSSFATPIKASPRNSRLKQTSPKGMVLSPSSKFRTGAVIAASPRKTKQKTKTVGYC